MTAAGQVRSEIVSRLKAAGLDAAEAYEDERFRERSGSVVAVGAKQAELAHAGLMNYLGEQYDAESGRTVEVYGRKLKMAASLDVYAPRRKGARGCEQTAEGVIEASYRDRRYGVLSEVTAVNRAKKLRQTVRNEAFLARGGSCRRVVYVPSRSVNELRYTGRYQIEKSAEDARELTVTLAGSVDAEPTDRVELSLARLGVRGTFRVSETLHTLSARGETTELTLWEV